MHVPVGHSFLLLSYTTMYLLVLILTHIWVIFHFFVFKDNVAIFLCVYIMTHRGRVFLKYKLKSGVTGQAHVRVYK